MKKFICIVLYGCLILISISGCGPTPFVVKVDKPLLSIGAIVAKLRPTDTARAFDKKGQVGVVVEVNQYVNSRSEAEVYKEVSYKVMSTLEQAGTSAALIYDEIDPRLENVGIILHVNYSESKGIKQVKNSNVYVPMPSKAGFGALGGMSVDGGYTSVSVIEPSYTLTIYNIKTGDRVYSSNLKRGAEEVTALKKQLEIQNKIEM